MKRLMIGVAAAAMTVAGTAYARTLRVREADLWSPSRKVAGKMAGRVASAYSDASAAIRAVTALNDRLGISADAESLRVRRTDTDRFGRMHVRLQQLYKGLEVDGRELIVHFGANGEVYEVNGDYLDGLALDTTPAVEVAGATLVVYCTGDDASSARLAWKLREGRNDVFTDAQTGEEIHRRRISPHVGGPRLIPDYLPFNTEELVRTAVSSSLPQGTATTVTGALPAQQGGATVSVGATQGTDGKTYLATRNAAGVEIAVLDGVAAPQFRATAQTAFWSNDGRWFETFHQNATFTAYSTESGEDPANALAIVHNLSVVLDYYAAAFNRSSYDGKGGRVAAWRFWNENIFDYDSGYNNAFWHSMGDVDEAKTPGCIFFGYDLTDKRSETTLDTCAHELTHGITSWSANLQYEAEPGALNESFSDVIAIACEFAAQPRAADIVNPRPGEADWLFDEDSGETSRSLANPKLFGQPSRYKGVKWVDTADRSDYNDYGGVHSNSGVQNFFFYLLSEGGRGSNEGVEYDLRGIGVEKAAQVAYLALTAYCGPRTGYVAVTSCWDSAALDLVESGVLTAADYAVVASAWSVVMGSGTTFDGTGEAVYASTNLTEDAGTTLLIKLGKADRKGLAKVTATLTIDGSSWKFSGKVSTATGVATLTNRKLGNLDLWIGPMSATATLDKGDGNLVNLSAVRISPSIAHVSGLDTLCVGVAASGSVALSGEVAEVRYSAKKLPSGMKIGTKTGEISGVPRKAGSGTATISAKCKFAVEGEQRPVSATVAQQATWRVAALDDFAQGKFTGDGVSITVSKVGKISGTVIVDGRKVRLSAKSYASRSGGIFSGEGTARDGTFTIQVDANGLHGVVTTTTGTMSFEATRNVTQ